MENLTEQVNDFVPIGVDFVLVAFADLTFLSLSLLFFRFLFAQTNYAGSESLKRLVIHFNLLGKLHLTGSIVCFKIDNRPR